MGGDGTDVALELRSQNEAGAEDAGGGAAEDVCGVCEATGAGADEYYCLTCGDTVYACGSCRSSGRLRREHGERGGHVFAALSAAPKDGVIEGGEAVARAVRMSRGGNADKGGRDAEHSRARAFGLLSLAVLAGSMYFYTASGTRFYDRRFLFDCGGRTLTMLRPTSFAGCTPLAEEDHDIFNYRTSYMSAHFIMAAISVSTFLKAIVLLARIVGVVNRSTDRHLRVVMKRNPLSGRGETTLKAGLALAVVCSFLSFPVATVDGRKLLLLVDEGYMEGAWYVTIACAAVYFLTNLVRNSIDDRIHTVTRALRRCAPLHKVRRAAVVLNLGSRVVVLLVNLFLYVVIVNDYSDYIDSFEFLHARGEGYLAATSVSFLSAAVVVASLV